MCFHSKSDNVRLRMSCIVLHCPAYDKPNVMLLIEAVAVLFNNISTNVLHVRCSDSLPIYFSHICGFRCRLPPFDPIKYSQFVSLSSPRTLILVKYAVASVASIPFIWIHKQLVHHVHIYLH